MCPATQKILPGIGHPLPLDLTSTNPETFTSYLCNAFAQGVLSQAHVTAESEPDC